VRVRSCLERFKAVKNNRSSLDDLSNMCFDKFKEANRIHVVGTHIKFLVMRELARESQLMFEKIKAVKSKRQLLDSKIPPEPVRSKKLKLESW
jgi:hypothetical protein